MKNKALFALAMALVLSAGCIYERETGRGSTTTTGMTEEEGEMIAEEFVRNSPKFREGGLDLEFKKSLSLSRCRGCWAYMFEFKAEQEIQTDESGDIIGEVENLHRALIVVEGGEITQAVLDGKWDMLRQVPIETERFCEKAGSGEKLSLSEAREIAMESKCVDEGELKETHLCNGATGTWWIDLDIEMEGCNPACVIDVATGKAEINWRCTGLKEGFCGSSSRASCEDDSGCTTGGCSGQVCQSVSEEGVISTCEWRECYDDEKYDLLCKCIEGGCQWTESGRGVTK